MSASVQDATGTSVPIGYDDVIANVRGLHDLIDSHGAENDREGRISEQVIDALFASGALRVFTPTEFGGSEVTPRQAMDVYRTLAYADPSTGWVSMAIAMVTGLAGAFLEPDAAKELFRTPRLAIAGQGTRSGRAEPVAGGYRVTGSWQFASGIKHSTHLHTAAADTQTGQNRFFLIPVEQVTFEENWDVLGLRGTGSIDYTLDDVFVPAEMSYPTLAVDPITGGSLYRIGIGNYASINHGAWALGLGRRLLDELAAAVQRKSGRAGSQAENTSWQEQYANAEIKLRAAHAFLYEVWEEIEGVLATGSLIPVRLETLNRAALSNATWTLDDVAGFVFRSGGTEALRAGTIQRLYRDVHGGTQHISSSPVILQSAGRQLAGLAEGQRWVHFSLA